MNFNNIPGSSKHFNIGAAILAPLYYLYLYLSSSILERKLMEQREKFYCLLVCWSLFGVGVGIIMYATFITNIVTMLLSTVIVAMMVFLIAEFKDVVTFKYKGHEYKIVSRHADKIKVRNTEDLTTERFSVDILDGRKLYEQSVCRLKTKNIQKYS